VRKNIFLTFFSVLFLIVSASSQGHAQNFILSALQQNKTPSPAPTEATPIPDELQGKRDELAQEIQKAQADQDNAPSMLEGGAIDFLKKKVSMLESLDLLYDQEIQSFQNNLETTASKVEMSKELDSWKTQGPPKDFKATIFTLDELRSEKLKQEKHANGYEDSLKSLQNTLIQAKQDSESLESQRRQAKEAAEGNRDPAADTPLRQALEEAQLKSRIAKEKIALQEMEIKSEKSSQDLTKIEGELLDQKIAWVKTNVHLTQAELDEAIRRIEVEEAALNEGLDQSRQDLARVDRQWVGARKKLGQTTDPAPSLKAEIETYRLERETFQARIAISGQELQMLSELKEVWRKRLLFLDGKVSRSDALDWQTKLRDEIDQLKRQEDLIRSDMSDMREIRAKIREKTSAPQGTDAATLAWLDRQQAELRNRTSFYIDTIANLTKTRDFYGQLLGDLGVKPDKLGLWERAQVSWKQLKQVWYFELTSVDDRPITVGKILSVLFLVILGFSISSRLSRFFGRTILPKMGMQPGVIAALQTLIFYLLITFVTILALYLVNVPLTLFTVLGGALAIGIGFGSQNIVKNFISGLILLIEHPIRVGDMVEIDGAYGLVDLIGARSTRIRTFSNTHIIVPNSDLLEKKVVNWTLLDDMSRATIVANVSYDSDPKEVARCLRKAVDQHAKVMKTPEPIVCFTEFGDNALSFEIYFWIHMRTMMERKIIESDIRFLLDDLLKEAGITFAYPQRDLSFKTDKPLNICIVPEAKANETPISPSPEAKPSKDNPIKLP